MPAMRQAQEPKAPGLVQQSADDKTPISDMKPKCKTRTAAVITVHDASNMTQKGRHRIAEWMFRQAYFLMYHSKELAKRYTARYLY